MLAYVGKTDKIDDYKGAIYKGHRVFLYDDAYGRE